MRYIMTGGDNGYCARCGGLGDRALLLVDDEHKSYKYFYKSPSCLGKHCWKKEELYGGRVIAKGVLVRKNKLVYDFMSPEKNKVYIVSINGGNLRFDRVIIKNNKYGKDGEFGDKLDSYKCGGFVEPDGWIEERKKEAKQAREELYNNFYKKGGSKNEY